MEDGVYKAQFEFDKMVPGTETKVQDQQFAKATTQKIGNQMPEEFAGMNDASSQQPQKKGQAFGGISTSTDNNEDVPQDW